MELTFEERIPWNQRRASAEHYQWFRNLIDFHLLTQSWLKSLDQNERSLPHQMRRVLSPGSHQALDVLENLTKSQLPSSIDSILDESYPGELLERLEYTVWAVQAWLLRDLLSRTPKEEATALKNTLEQGSWSSGRTCAEKRWPLLPELRRNHLSGILASFQDSALSGYPSKRPYLLVRSTAEKLSLELLNCPHQSRYSEVASVADELCFLHHQWIRGFAYGINHQVIVDYEIRSSKRSRCRQTWYFHESRS